MERYPVEMAVPTTFAASSFGTCQTPKPSWGITLPSLRLMVGSVPFLLSSFRTTLSAVRSLQDNYHFLCPITKSDVGCAVGHRSIPERAGACPVAPVGVDPPARGALPFAVEPGSFATRTDSNPVKDSVRPRMAGGFSSVLPYLFQFVSAKYSEADNSTAATRGTAQNRRGMRRLLFFVFRSPSDQQCVIAVPSCQVDDRAGFGSPDSNH